MKEGLEGQLRTSEKAGIFHFKVIPLYCRRQTNASVNGIVKNGRVGMQNKIGPIASLM
jgi:hypothetical protein